MSKSLLRRERERERELEVCRITQVVQILKHSDYWTTHYHGKTNVLHGLVPRLCPPVLRARLNNLRNIRKFLVTPCSVRENMSVVPSERNLSGKKTNKSTCHAF